jgi:flagellin-like hook-associated protein FlgL
VFRISYAVAGDNTFLLTIPLGSPDGCETGFPVSPTGLLVDEDTITVTANSMVVPRSSSQAGDGWYLHPPVPGTTYKGVQLYSEYKIELVGAHALSGDGNNVRITYDRLDPSTTGALRVDLLGGARAVDIQRWQLEAVTVETLGLGAICLMDATEASEAIGLCDGAIVALTRRLNRLGAYMNRVGHQTAALGIQRTLAQRAQSNLVDADVASEAVIQTRQRILMDSARAMAAMDLERLRDRARLLTG